MNKSHLKRPIPPRPTNVGRGILGRIFDEAQKNEKLFPLLSMVNKKPGIRQKELEDLPEVSSETLHKDLESMERKGYLLGKGLGRNRSYILSIEGAELYEMYESLIGNRFYDA